MTCGIAGRKPGHLHVAVKNRRSPHIDLIKVNLHLEAHVPSSACPGIVQKSLLNTSSIASGAETLLDSRNIEAVVRAS